MIDRLTRRTVLWLGVWSPLLRLVYPNLIVASQPECSENDEHSDESSHSVANSCSCSGRCKWFDCSTGKRQSLNSTALMCNTTPSKVQEMWAAYDCGSGYSWQQEVEFFNRWRDIFHDHPPTPLAEHTFHD